ncbi:MAG: cyanophycinase [Dehalococcoidia bacterium]|nr:cyanophycinase [Dehalococcoidia bacterium]MCL4231269.1 cyanophycinase [Dehalococcoidia bacterium]NUQ56745.1 cyanophycinase [Dehalococcoidia bacterium]
MRNGGGFEGASGTLVLIGGGDYEQSEQVDRVVLELAGGAATPVVFLPTPHTSRRVGEKFAAYYQSLGARDVTVAPVYEREDAEDEANARLLREAGLIFIGWGSDLRLQQVITGTPVHAAIEEAHRRGALLAGTSAGARVAGELVISPANGPVGLRGGLDPGPPHFNYEVPLDQKTVLQVWPGFNWLPGFGVEAHLAEWQRYGHLLLMGAIRPDITWLGLDERTAVIIEPGGSVRVIGSGNVVVARRTPSVRAVEPRPGRALEARGLRLDVLSAGSETSLDELRRPVTD